VTRPERVEKSTRSKLKLLEFASPLSAFGSVLASWEPWRFCSRLPCEVSASTAGVAAAIPIATA
jgi:hypothetical protein